MSSLLTASAISPGAFLSTVQVSGDVLHVADENDHQTTIPVNTHHIERVRGTVLPQLLDAGANMLYSRRDEPGNQWQMESYPDSNWRKILRSVGGRALLIARTPVSKLTVMRDVIPGETVNDLIELRRRSSQDPLNYLDHGVRFELRGDKSDFVFYRRFALADAGLESFLREKSERGVPLAVNGLVLSAVLSELTQNSAVPSLRVQEDGKDGVDLTPSELRDVLKGKLEGSSSRSVHERFSVSDGDRLLEVSVRVGGEAQTLSLSFYYHNNQGLPPLVGNDAKAIQSFLETYISS